MTLRRELCAERCSREKMFPEFLMTGWTRTGYPSRLMDLQAKHVRQLLIASGQSRSSARSSSKHNMELIKEITRAQARRSTEQELFSAASHFTKVMQTFWVYIFPPVLVTSLWLQVNSLEEFPTQPLHKRTELRILFITFRAELPFRVTCWWNIISIPFILLKFLSSSRRNNGQRRWRQALGKHQQRVARKKVFNFEWFALAWWKFPQNRKIFAFHFCERNGFQLAVRSMLEGDISH